VTEPKATTLLEVVVLWLGQRLLGWYARRNGQTAVVLLYGAGEKPKGDSWVANGPERPQ